MLKKTVCLLCMLFFFTESYSQDKAIMNNVLVFQNTTNPDSIIQTGEYIIKNYKFNKNAEADILFFTFLFGKLSLAYVQNNNFKKIDNMLVSLNDSSVILDYTNFLTLVFYSNVIQNFTKQKKINDAVFYLQILKNIIRNEWKEDKNAEAIYLKELLNIKICEDNSNTSDSIIKVFKTVVNSEFSASKFIFASVDLIWYYDSKDENKKAEKLLLDAYLVDSMYGYTESELLNQIYIVLNSKFNGTNKIENKIDEVLNEFTKKVNKNQIGTDDVLKIGMTFHLFTQDTKPSEIDKQCLIKLFDISVYNIKSFKGVNKSHIIELLRSASLVIRDIDILKSEYALNIGREIIENDTNYYNNSEYIYLVLSDLYIYKYILGKYEVRNYLIDSSESCLKSAFDIIKKQDKFNTSSYESYINSLAFKQSIEGDSYNSFSNYLNSLNSNCSDIDSIIDKRCIGTLLQLFIESRRINDRSKAIFYFEKWRNSWKRYIEINKLYLIPNYQNNEYISSCVETFNTYVILDSLKDKYIDLFENLLIYKYYQLSAKVELKNFGVDQNEFYINSSIGTPEFIINNRNNISNLLKTNNVKRNNIVYDVLNSLDSIDVGIEIFKINYLNKNFTYTDMYYALVIFGDSKKIMCVYLGEKSEILEAINISKNSLVHGDDYIRMYNQNDLGLARYFVNPILPLISNYKRLYISAYGLFNKINLNILNIDDHLILEDLFEIHNIFTLSDMPKVKKSDFVIDPTVSINLFGDIYFNRKNKENLLDLNYKGNSYSTRSLKSNWEYLPETKFEVSRINDLFNTNGNKVSLYTKYEANEKSFYSSITNKSSIYHMATHGFSLFNRIDDTLNSGFLNNQLDLSGLILSGANDYWTNTFVGYSNRKDGILTGSELANLNLTQCKLFTMSACESGLGIEQVNDGVFGLQRSLKLAGVNNIISSLWSVPDKSTRELFEYFYDFLIKGHRLSDSLKLARSKLRKMYQSPYYWGAFILIE